MICHRIRIFCALIVALIATGTRAATDGSAEATQASAQARAVVEWGDPEFTVGEVYAGPGPAWWLGGGKFGGDWFAGGWKVFADAVGPADLLMFLDREALTNNLRFAAELALAPGSDLRLDLLDAQFQVLQADVLGNLAGVASARGLALPLATQPRASVIRLRRFSGATLVGICELYIDEDGDGLDADQERQAGTSDFAADSDGDGLSDYEEVRVFRTDPIRADSDGDGVPDGKERRRRTDPNSRTSCAAVIYVDSDRGNDANDGLGPTEGATGSGPKRTVAAAIESAVSGDTVWLSGESPFDAPSWRLGGKSLKFRMHGTKRFR